jgi:hypothetical protein
LADEHEIISEDFLPPTTAGIHPEKFGDELAFSRSGKVTALILIVMIVVGFGLRVRDLGAESFGEDELNKLQTVEEYRTNGLSGRNGEHPFLMKGLQTVSLSIGEYFGFSDEASLRFPIALFGAFSTLFLFLVVRELFGRSIALVSAALYAVEPVAIGFDRIAKEDSLVLFFFLLTNLLWLRGQTLAERGVGHWLRYAFGAGVAFAALMASKYYPHLLAVTAGYYNIYEYVPERNWRFGRPRWLLLFVVMAAAFVVLNPTIVFPETWHEMLRFSSENRVGHDGFEFMGDLYKHRVTDWLSGIPWTFYYVFIVVKTSLPVLVLFLAGLPMMFFRRLGDGRFFIFVWAYLFFMPFSLLGGKFTRYFTIAEPLVLITAATAFYFSAKWLSSKLKLGNFASGVFQTLLFCALIGGSLFNAASSGPHYRMFTNILGGGKPASGSYFPHDEFYDAATRDVITALSGVADRNATIACETPGLFAYYAKKTGRGDLKFISLSDKQKVKELTQDDVVVVVKGRRYFSNDAYQQMLTHVAPTAKVSVANITAAEIYALDEATLEKLKEIANRN